MNVSFHVSLWGSVARLLLRIWRRMPALASAWLAIPLLLGALIVPGLAAQRDLVDLFASGVNSRGWDEIIKLAWPPLAVFTGIALGKAGLGSVQNLLDTKLRDQASLHVQSEVHRRAYTVALERLDQPDYYDRLQRARTVAGESLFGVLQNVLAVLRYVFEWAGLFVVVWLVHPVIGVVLAIVCLLSFAIRLESEIVVRRLNRDLTRSGRQSDYLHEELLKPETVKELRLHRSIDFLLRKWLNLLAHSLQLRMNARRREIRHGIVVSVLQISGLIGAVLWMVLQLKAGQLTAGKLVIVLQAMRQAYGISSRLQHPVSKLYMQGTHIVDLVVFLGETPLPDKNVIQPSQLPGETGLIELHDVAYQYAGADKPVLDGIRLTLYPGETVALVGENGAGKSTLVKLLLGLYRPTKGRITWDGADYAELDAEKLYTAMSAVFQDYVKYETTLRDNVSFGLVSGLNEDRTIYKALLQAGAIDLAQKPEGFDTRVGLVTEGGVELSGGQWQRLAIARAASRNAKLLVLDEPTAALDPQHERELYGSFRNLSQERTVLFVSHRLGWARFADRIVVLRDGRIVEEGTHDSLLANGGEYATMFEA